MLDKKSSTKAEYLRKLTLRELQNLKALQEKILTLTVLQEDEMIRQRSRKEVEDLRDGTLDNLLLIQAELKNRKCMNSKQHQELQAIMERIGSSQLEELETVFEQYWKPFVLALSSEEDKVLAFKIFYKWQFEQTEILKNHVMGLPLAG